MKSFICILLALALAEATIIRPNRLLPRFLKDEERIVGGQEAPKHAFPYQAAVMSDLGFCGGSVISRTTILTAAHCTDGATQIEVVLAAHNFDEEEPEQMHFETTNFTVHEGWNRKKLENDLSLVFLPEPIPESPYVRIIDLPSKSDADEPFDGYPARISGWGRIGDGQGSSPFLKYIDSYIITNKECKNTFGSYYIQDSTICASGKGNQSTCNGDSGGPMVIHKDGKIIQVGIASFVSGAGCSKSYPHAYARVSKFLDWIAAHSDVVIN